MTSINDQCDMPKINYGSVSSGRNAELAALVEFLEARLKEEWEDAMAATRGPWVVLTGSTDVSVEQRGAPDNHLVADMNECWDHPNQQVPDAKHIARWNPQRVLNEVKYKVRIINDALGSAERWLTEDVLMSLAMSYSLHADYRGSWVLP